MSTVVISDEVIVNEVVINEEKTVVVHAQASQGPAGPPGPPGSGGSGEDLYYQHTQSLSATSWTVNHNLGKKVNCNAYSVGGKEIWAEIVQVNDNQTLVHFDQPTAGYAICS